MASTLLLKEDMDHFNTSKIMAGHTANVQLLQFLTVPETCLPCGQICQGGCCLAVALPDMLGVATLGIGCVMFGPGRRQQRGHLQQDQMLFTLLLILQQPQALRYIACILLQACKRYFAYISGLLRACNDCGSSVASDGALRARGSSPCHKFC